MGPHPATMFAVSDQRRCDLVLDIHRQHLARLGQHSARRWFLAGLRVAVGRALSRHLATQRQRPEIAAYLAAGHAAVP